MKKIRVLVVDDHPLMREALCAAIEAETDLAVAGEAAGGRAGVEQARVLQPDVIVMDLLMPDMDGLEAIAAICAEDPEAHILALTSSTEESKVLAAVQAGALGYLLKDARREDLLHAIREVGRGHAHLPSAVALKLMHSMRQQPPETPVTPDAPVNDSLIKRLTPRQRQVFDLLGQGLSDREIAEKLVLSEATVRSHIYHILGRLGLEKRSQAVAYAAANQEAHRGPKQNEWLD